MLLLVVEDGLAWQREPVAIPASGGVPEGGPHPIVEADHKEIEVAVGSRHGSDVLLVAVEHGLAGKREPIAAPPARGVPEGGPDPVVETDHEQIEIALGARHD